MDDIHYIKLQSSRKYFVTNLQGIKFGYYFQVYITISQDTISCMRALMSRDIRNTPQGDGG